MFCGIVRPFCCVCSKYMQREGAVWPDEFVKKSPKMKPNPFCKNWYTYSYLLPRKNIFGLLMQFSISLPKVKQSLNGENSPNQGSILWSQISSIFANFRPKMVFFSKANVMINLFQKLAVVWVKTLIFSPIFWAENILKIGRRSHWSG
jgi:hypothetical protein